MCFMLGRINSNMAMQCILIRYCTSFETPKRHRRNSSSCLRRQALYTETESSSQSYIFINLITHLFYTLLTHAFKIFKPSISILCSIHTVFKVFSETLIHYQKKWFIFLNKPGIVHCFVRFYVLNCNDSFKWFRLFCIYSSFSDNGTLLLANQRTEVLCRCIRSLSSISLLDI